MPAMVRGNQQTQYLLDMGIGDSAITLSSYLNMHGYVANPEEITAHCPATGRVTVGN